MLTDSPQSISMIQTLIEEYQLIFEIDEETQNHLKKLRKKNSIIEKIEIKKKKTIKEIVDDALKDLKINDNEEKKN
jgi:hypothetical protein